MFINTEFRNSYLTDFRDKINAGVNSCYLYLSNIPSPATVRSNPLLYTQPSYSSNVIASISVSNTSIATLTSLNNGIDIQFEPENSVFAINAGVANWFMFYSSFFPFYVWGNVDIPANHPDVAILDTNYFVGREVDFQNIKIRLLQLEL